MSSKGYGKCGTVGERINERMFSLVRVAYAWGDMGGEPKGDVGLRIGELQYREGQIIVGTEERKEKEGLEVV